MSKVFIGNLRFSPLWKVTLVFKNSPANSGDMRHRFDPWVGMTPEGGHGNSLQCSCLENAMDRGAWWDIVPMVTEGQT